jgi:hypothetical protein
LRLTSNLNVLRFFHFFDLREFAAKEKLEIVNALGFAFHFARPPIPSPAKRDEDRIPFELFQEYTAI